ncbi:MAG TPA: hypothetical protein VLY04_07705 [Bryobacteraceae bacterium]|nr:hypothetical protein [Bryobacteraceae bacterium]
MPASGYQRPFHLCSKNLTRQGAKPTKNEQIDRCAIGIVYAKEETSLQAKAKRKKTDLLWPERSLPESKASRAKTRRAQRKRTADLGDLGALARNKKSLPKQKPRERKPIVVA